MGGQQSSNAGSGHDGGQAKSVDILVLGAGWTATFLIPLLKEHHPKLSYASTTRSGGGPYDSIPFTFDPSTQEQSASANQWSSLPDAGVVLVTFPIKVPKGSRNLVAGFCSGRPSAEVKFIQLGSTGIFNVKDDGPLWYDRHGPIDTSDARGQAEQELLSLSGSRFGDVQVLSTVLNLAGLQGGQRLPLNWIGKVLPSKEKLAGKGSLHLVHGLDVSRAVVAAALMREGWTLAGERWILTDEMVYDWWTIAWTWSSGDAAAEERGKWVLELMREQDVRALPRDMAKLGRCVDSRETWETLAIRPARVGIADA